jgi:hypothetical protein
MVRVLCRCENARVFVSRFLPLLLVPAIALPLTAKDKKKETLSDLILRARYATVIISPDAGVSPASPAGDQTARTDVETALEKWGRFHLTQDAANADLIIVVRKGGQAVKPTLGGGNPNDHPVVVDPGSGGEIRLGGHSRPPSSGDGSSSPSGPLPRAEVGDNRDIFSVYRSNGIGASIDSALDAPPLWRYASSDALKHPSVPAVEKFRKAIEDAEKANPHP